MSTHWLIDLARPDEERLWTPACGGEPDEPGTVFMSEVSCRTCQTIVQLTIDLVLVEPEMVERIVPPPGDET